MEEEMNLRLRRKKSSVGIICCFTGGNTAGRHQRRASFDTASYNSSTALISHPSPRWSPGWFKSKSNNINTATGDHHHHQLVEPKGKCRSFISRMGRHASAEFSYDPLSYSLNFDDDVDDDSRVMSFSARFPASPSSSRRIRTPHDDHDHDDSIDSDPDRPGHLTRGFESLAQSMEMTRNKSGLPSSSSSSSRAPPHGDETPVRIPPKPEILLQMC